MLERIQLQKDYWMDRFEVSQQRSYKRFVDGGGYQKTRVLEAPVSQRRARGVLGEIAMAEFRDVTGRPGPVHVGKLALDHPRTRRLPVAGVS